MFSEVSDIYCLFNYYGTLLKDQIMHVGNEMPQTQTDAKKLLNSIGMEYNKIHACRNACILFCNKHEHLQECPQCGSSRYIEDVIGKAIPVKVLRHFPIIPRLKSMFRCKDIARLMTWHQFPRSTDEVMQVTTDSPA